MENKIIYVNDNPYVLWDKEIKENNKIYLNSIDSEYFDFILNLVEGQQDENRISLLLRSTFYHSLEMMFSLLCALIQSPLSAYAWIPKCDNNSLRKIITRINNQENTLHCEHPNISTISWYSISSIIFYSKDDTIKKEFAHILELLANELINEKNIDEYNSIKHGLRVRKGGFHVSLFNETNPNTKYKIGGSKFGTSWYKIKKLKKDTEDRSFFSQKNHLNWSLERTNALTQVISVLIYNVTSALKAYNNYENTQFDFKFFENFEDIKNMIKDDMSISHFELPAELSKYDNYPKVTKKSIEIEIKKQLSNVELES